MRFADYATRGYVGVFERLEQAAAADVIIKCAEAGPFEHLLESAVPEVRKVGGVVAHLDWDAPATLGRMRRDPGDPLLAPLPEYDLVLMAGGGLSEAVAFRALGARECLPLWSLFDPVTRQIVPPAPEPPAGEGGMAVTLHHVMALEWAFAQALAVRAQRPPAVKCGM